MDEYGLICKIHEIKSYIASDWPGVEERKTLYETLRTLEGMLKEMRNAPKEVKPQED